jgi:hypothetical protein
MYWLNTNKLAVDLREGRVDEKEQFKYYLATFIAWNIGLPLFVLYGAPFGVESLLSIGAGFIIAIIGIMLCYRANRSGDNKDFVPRMICLNWILGFGIAVWLSAIPVIFGFLSSLVALKEGFSAFLDGLSAIPLDVIQFWTRKRDTFFFCVILVLLYYFFLYWSIAWVAQSEAEHFISWMVRTKLSTSEAVIGLVGLIGTFIIAVLVHDPIIALVGPGPPANILIVSTMALWFIVFGFIFVRLRMRSYEAVLKGESAHVGADS